MNYLQKLFNRGIKWNSLEVIIYQTTLTVHQIVLFLILDKCTYGLVGTLFALLYFLITILNFALDKSLTPFFMIFTESKNYFKKIFLSQLIIQILLFFSAAVTLLIFKNKITQIFSNFFKCNVQEEIWLILGILIILEGIKKNLRIIGQLAFLNKQTCIIEIITIILYTTITWSWFFYSKEMNLNIIFTSMIFESMISLLMYSKLTLNIYKGLPTNPEKTKINNKNIFKRIIKIRISNYVNQIGGIFFTSNFLIIFFGYMYGLAQVSILKLTNNISILFSIIVHKVFGLTSEAFLSHVKILNLKTKKEALNQTTRKLFTFLFCILIFVSINYKWILNIIKNISLFETYIFFLITFLESFFITYELYFLIEEKFFYITFINVFFTTLFYILINIFHVPLILCLIYLVFIRLAAFFTIRLISSYKLKVNLPYQINFKYLLASFFVSISTYILISLITKLIHF